MATSLKPPAVRTHAKDLHADLQAIRGGSHLARIAVNPSVSREALRAAMAETRTSQKAFALAAGQPESVVSDALNARGRHLETDWILAQDDALVLAFVKHIQKIRGLSPQAAHDIYAEQIGQLVTALLKHRGVA